MRLASSGAKFVIPADKTIAEVLLGNGVDVPLSCEQGICGTCMVPVLEGEPEHRDFFMSEYEHTKNDQMTLCCSRARSKELVIDL
ncbi:2Fe-2S iron-sulfur cluster-binding protein [Microbulbifer sp.]|uniref:2Fe-2S iron-sulfur cluster-binding protein n=1 Tax=Microbulbifer sp. TaxID=1908541 RepID=UPI003F3BF365